MTPADIANLTAFFLRLRMDALKIVSDRMPNASVETLMEEAEKIIKWAGQSNGSS